MAPARGAHAAQRDAPAPQVASITFANMIQHKTGTINLVAGPATTAVTFAVQTSGGGVYRQTVTTDGTGAASITVVPEMVGNPQVTVTQQTTTTVATGTTFVSGH
jgi:hypothetical protein